MNRLFMAGVISLLSLTVHGAEAGDSAFNAWLSRQSGILERLRAGIRSDRAAGNTARAESEQLDLELLERRIGEEKEFFKNAPDLTANGKLDVRDFGARGDGVTDDTAAIRRAIDAALAGKVRQVFLPRGRYLVKHHPELMPKFNPWSDPVSDDYHPANSGAIVIMGKNLLLSGEKGTELLVDSPQDIALHIINSDNVRVSDLVIRYTRALTVSGTIVALTGEDSIDVELDPGAADPLAGYFRERGFKGLMRFYNEKRREGDNRPEFSNAAIHQIAPEVTKVGENRYRFQFKNFLPVRKHYRPGMHVTYYARSYTDHAVCNYCSAHTRLERLTITGAPTVAFYNFNSEMPFILDCEVIPEKGRFESTCADGVYFKTGFGGYVSGNRFYGIGDDFINIHSRLAPVKKQKGNTLYLPAKIWPEQTWRQIRRVGIVRSARNETNACMEATLSSWELVPGGLVKATFREELPPLETGKTPDVLFLPDREWHGLVITGNRFEHSVSRVLVGGRNIEVTDNYFLDSLDSHSLVMSGLEAITGAGGESRFPRNLFFARNEFRSKAKSVIQFQSRLNQAVNGIFNIEHFEIRDNLFDLYGDSTLPVCNLSSADGVVFAGNRVTASGNMSGPVVEVRNCVRASVFNNQATGNFPEFLNDAGENKELTAENNRIVK